MLCLGTCAPAHRKQLCLEFSRKKKKPSKKFENANQVWKILYGELLEHVNMSQTRPTFSEQPPFGKQREEHTSLSCERLMML